MRTRDFFSVGLYELDELTVEGACDFLLQKKQELINIHPDATNITISLCGNYDETEIEFSFERNKTELELQRERKRLERTEKAKAKYRLKKEESKQNMKVIEDSYNDYICIDDEKQKEIISNQIVRTAKGFIRNSNGKLEDWLKVFAKEKIVIAKLKQIK